MPKTTILFVCPDNALLSPLAECYVNQCGGGLVRAFSAGLDPCSAAHPALHGLLESTGLHGRELQPKSLDVFFLPHAPIIDRMILLSGVVPSQIPAHIQSAVDRQDWPIAVEEPGGPNGPRRAYRQIRDSIDRMLGRSVLMARDARRVA
ncbi:hypothetical protein GCM10011316_19660 [Roseibium aquae]|uniref:Protein-tyrosine-phosphatase n=1 Tax=Roseibium aquae TaxID=1323746 RepID=A0A916TIY5_9HYPH|nr:hypothetical protein GCM10011316_19660 [Roseibium aquae]